jgi:fatty acid desaturase
MSYRSNSKSLVLRHHSDGGWKTIVALVYALAGNATAVWWMLRLALNDAYHRRRYDVDDEKFWFFFAVVMFIPPIILSAHSKIIAAYLVHDACHDSVFVTKNDNRQFGILCLWLCGCPYIDYDHVKRMHVAHHVDRTDLVEFDHRSFVTKNIVFKAIVLSLEFVGIPAVETIMHLRQAFVPVVAPRLLPDKGRSERIFSSMVGTPAIILWYIWLWRNEILVPQIISGIIFLQTLALNDAFQHTYQAVLQKDYSPGPGSRTAQYEEDNTYSNVWSTSFPIINILMLNFGYHNAHHKRPMVPWHQLPRYHDKLYRSTTHNDGGMTSSKGKGGRSSTSNDSKNSTDVIGNINVKKEQVKMTSLAESTPQILPLRDLLWSWFRHRSRRVVEDDYGVVHPQNTPNRASDFVGALGVSFLTA